VSGEQAYLAIVNPAREAAQQEDAGSGAGAIAGGRGRVEVAETQGCGDATRIAREAYGRGRRKFIAVGGDGTSYEVVNGFPAGV